MAGVCGGVGVKFGVFQSLPHPTVRPNLSVHRELALLNCELDQIVSEVRLVAGLAQYLEPDHIYSRGSTVYDIERCVLYMEDRTFFHHTGVGLRSLMRAAVRPLMGKKVGAVSTIDQQVVRLALSRYERTARRKAREISLAFAMNSKLPKNDILTYYINRAYCGYNITGLGTAALIIFQQDARALSPRACALLTSLLALPMPSVVVNGIKEGNIDFTRGVSEGLVHARAVAPRWSSRIEWRMNVAVQFQSFKPTRR